MKHTLLEMLSHQAAGVALAVSDASGLLTMTTPALARMLGQDLGSVSEQALQPLDVRDPLTDRLLAQSEIPLVRACAGEVVTDQVVTVRRPDGLRIYLRCSASPLQGGDGEAQGAIALVQDVTAEWTLTQKQTELRDRLVGTINHELRTPLTKILGHCELLGELTQGVLADLPVGVAHSLRAIERAGRELAALARRITDLADLEAVTQVVAAPLDLSALVREEVALQSRPQTAQIALTAPASLVVSVDGRLVAAAVRELLGNALRHAPPGSRVEVRLRPGVGYVVITVADQGVGIPAHDRERMLEPFERGESLDPSDSSPGLGLAVVSAVAAAHGGSVDLQENEPRGLVVVLTLICPTG